MASLTINNLENDVRAKLSAQAAKHGRSIEEEARSILSEALAELPRQPQEPPPENMYTVIRRFIEPLGGVELDIPPRGPGREPPKFD